MKKSIHLIICTLCLFLLGCSAKKQEVSSTKLGVINFQVSSKDVKAVEHFENGVLLMHSFMYQEAAESFKLAQDSDPDFAMAYWGEAMTYNHPLWSEHNIEKSTSILNRLGSTPKERMAKAQTEFEKDMLQSAEILFGEGDKAARDDAYSAYMAKLHDKYPDNHEIAAFYALSLMGSVDDGRDYGVYGKAAKVAQNILDENPEHPGALHYLIHAYDDPGHAVMALEAANKYSTVAPDAGHALHMPSHIYIALGMWDEVIASNIRSFDARLNKIERTGKGKWNLHAYRWLMYGYLQKGELAKADEIMEKMIDYIKEENSNYTRAYFINMVGNYCAENHQWDNEYITSKVDIDDLNVLLKATQAFIDGMHGIETDNVSKVEENIKALGEHVSKAKVEQMTKGIKVCSAVSRASQAPNQSDVDQSTLLGIILKAKLAEKKMESDEMVESLLKEAVALEDKIPFNFGPPTIYPSYEYYGEWLLKKERYEESIVQFEKSLEKGPGRKNPLANIKRAKKGLVKGQLTAKIN